MIYIFVFERVKFIALTTYKKERECEVLFPFALGKRGKLLHAIDILTIGSWLGGNESDARERQGREGSEARST